MGFEYDQKDIHLRYEKSRRLPEETMTLWLESISKYVPRNSTRIIVDLGCGAGRFTEGLSAHFSASVYGIDPSWKMLSQALKTLDQKGTGIAGQAIASPTVRFIQASAEGIPLTNSSADLIFLSMVYHHIRDKVEAVCEFRRVLKSLITSSLWALLAVEVSLRCTVVKSGKSLSQEAAIFDLLWASFKRSIFSATSLA